MIIYVSQIIKNNGAVKTVNGEIAVNDFEFNGQKLHFVTPFCVKGELKNIEGVLYLTANVSVKFITQCSRCLEPVNEEMQFKVEEHYAKSEQNGDDDVVIIDLNEIDMKEAVEKSFCSNLPINYLCSNDCKGLCPICGCNLNNEVCDCKEDYTDPRLAVLKNFLK